MKYALRNILRARRRSVYTFLAVFYPSLILVIMFGFVAGELQGMFESVTKLETGHLQIQGEGRLSGSAMPLFALPRDSLQTLSAIGVLEFWTMRLDLPALAAVGGRSYGVLIQGVEPEKIARISPIPGLISKGRYISGPYEAVVGEELAHLLDLEIGDPLVLLSAHPDAGIGAGVVCVVGIFTAPQEEFGRTVVQVPLETARRLIRMDDGVTSVVGFVKNVRGPWDAWKINQVTKELREVIPKGLVVRDFQELAPEFALFLRVARPLLAAFSAIFYFLGGLVVLNSYYLSVLERTRELGVIRALGAGRRWIMWAILEEALVLSGAGATLGALLGASFVALVEHFGGLRLPGAYSGFLRAFGMEPVLHLRVTPLEVLSSALAMMAVGVLSSWYPARRAAWLDPVEAMRHVA